MRMKTLIFPVLGGRGNRYFQLNAAISIALSQQFDRVLCLVRNNEDFCFEDIDIDINSPLLSGLKFEYLRVEGRVDRLVWKLIHIQIRLALGSFLLKSFLLSCTGIALTLILAFQLRERVRVVASDNIGFVETENKGTSILCIGYFQSSKYGTYVKQLYRRDEEKPITTQCNKESKRVMIHLRKGDYKFSPELGILAPAYYAKIIDDLMQENTLLHFSIFSDEELGEEIVQDVVGRKSVNLDVNLYPGNLYGDKVSFALMSEHFDYYIIANSSFSYWAAVIGQSEDSKVFYPYPWFKNAPTPRFLVNDHWIKCRAEFENSL
jgi:hypothetical protein